MSELSVLAASRRRRRFSTAFKARIVEACQQPGASVAQVIDKGIPTVGPLAQGLAAKYADHLPLYRQSQIFARAGVVIPRSTLAEWIGICGVRLQPLIDTLREALLTKPILHTDETPVPKLVPGKKKTHKAYLWAYATTPTPI